MRGREVWEKEIKILRRSQDTITKGEIKWIINEGEMTSDNDQLDEHVEEIMEVNVGHEDQRFVMDAANQAITRTLVQTLQRGLMQCPGSMLRGMQTKGTAISNKEELTL